VEALSHVVNFDVPNVPEDYIHRVGRTARAEMTGDAITFVAPEEEGDLRAIERAVGKRLPRVTVPDFDYTRRPAEKLEIPIQERIAAIRARKAEERARAKEKAERKSAAQTARGAGPAAAPKPRSPQRPAQARPAQGRPAQGRPAQARPAQGRPAQGRPGAAAAPAPGGGDAQRRRRGRRRP
jgi:ATP-dependent RNA helicase RhlE